MIRNWRMLGYGGWPDTDLEQNACLVHDGEFIYMSFNTHYQQYEKRKLMKEEKNKIEVIFEHNEDGCQQLSQLLEEMQLTVKHMLGEHRLYERKKEERSLPDTD